MMEEKANFDQLVFTPTLQVHESYRGRSREDTSTAILLGPLCIYGANDIQQRDSNSMAYEQ